MTGDTSLVNIGSLTRPATVLIQKISDAVGGLYKPYQIIRVAQANAEASRIQAETQVQVDDLHRRAMRRFLDEEAQKQSNIESITEKALPLLNPESRPADVERDWIANFFDKSRIVSDEQMQELWSRVLAGEANAPGSFAKRTVNLLGDLDKEDALLFIRLCCFQWDISNTCVPLVFDLKASIYKAVDLSWNQLSHLDSLGLIQFDNLAGFQILNLDKTMQISYFDRNLTLTLPLEADNSMDIGKVLLTRAGEQLAAVCEASPVDGVFEYVVQRLSESTIATVETSAKTDTTSPSKPAL